MPASSRPRPASPLRRRLVLLLLDVSLLGLMLAALQSNGQFPLAQARAPVEVAPTPPAPSPEFSPTTPGAPAAVRASQEEASITANPPLGSPQDTGEASEAMMDPSTSSRLSPTTTPLAGSPPSPVLEIAGNPAYPGTLFLSIDEGGRSHLFAYHPMRQPLTRLTAGPWDDITPALSPDGRQLAFASNRDGQWDLYRLDLSTGETTRLTATAEYDAAPSWSPDGRWLAYETYQGDPAAGAGGLEILLRQLPDEYGYSPDPVQLTADPAADSSPAWSPNGRQIAFISDRSGEAEVWLADLDQVENRFQNLSRSPQAQEVHPTWSPDGRSLAWASAAGGFRSLYILEVGAPGRPPRYMGSGDWPAWSPDGNALATALTAPNHFYLAGYITGPTPGLSLPPLALEGSVGGLYWGNGSLPQPLPGPLATAGALIPTPAWQPALTAGGEVPAGRRTLAPLGDVSAPFALLQDRVDEAFSALRAEVAARAGWDFLASLENAYVPLTAPLFPGMEQDWLYTGRAFAFHPAPLQAGWVVAVREDYGPETYWRVYVRARAQDGSQGMPLPARPWDFGARSSGDPRAYEQGGALALSVPSGYWLDFTALAAGYGWQRLPALTTWRSAYGAARYNEFVRTDGLDWSTAMQEIYPSEALVTPTSLSPSSDVPTPLPPTIRIPTAVAPPPVTPTRPNASP